MRKNADSLKSIVFQFRTKLRIITKKWRNCWVIAFYICCLSGYSFKDFFLQMATVYFSDCWWFYLLEKSEYNLLYFITSFNYCFCQSLPFFLTRKVKYFIFRKNFRWIFLCCSQTFLLSLNYCILLSLFLGIHSFSSKSLKNILEISEYQISNKHFRPNWLSF